MIYNKFFNINLNIRNLMQIITFSLKILIEQMLKKTTKITRAIVFVTFNLLRRKFLIDLFRKIPTSITFSYNLTRKMNRYISNVRR